MNYRHSFHAGNFADVVKHAVLARIVLHLKKKDAAFRVIDTHAGTGLYDLKGSDANRTNEWREGIGRLIGATLSPAAQDLLAPYLEAVRACNPPDALTRYPGSPILIRHWLRAQDRLTACELHPETASALETSLRGDARIKAIEIDGWTALNAYIPPKERRGLVLIDPPFEEPGEYDRLADALAAAHRKWPTGLYLAWYPIKDARECAAFSHALARTGIGKMLQAELTLAAPEAERLRGTGLIVVNPPWTLESELRILLPELARIIGGDHKGGTKVAWLGGPNR
jgi:23S rRNA (adenine2030-N6)-methyltransferase